VNLASLWCLDPSVTYLNHGSFGACPSAVQEMQASLRMEMEREPVDFLLAVLPARLDAAREALGAAPEDLCPRPDS
jgi:isopenicillin-N epimerase